jgi:hypothetical protein
MKKIILFLFISLVLIGCKNESKSVSFYPDEDTTELITLSGDFIYYADAAVLQTTNEIYGVVIDEKMHELNEAVKSYKNELTDMVSVTVKAKKYEKPENEEGWPFRIEIKEIVKVVKPNLNKKDVIKIGQ